FAFQVGLAIGLISLLPTPVFPQYFCLCIPFLLVSAVCVIKDLLAELESRRARLIAAAACIFLLGIYIASSADDFRAYLITGDGVPGIRWANDKADWRLQRVIEVSQAIDHIASPGEVVASFWPGDIFQTKSNPFPGLENDFALLVSEKLNSQQRARYHMPSPAEVETDLAAHRPRVVVLRDQILVPPSGEAARRLRLMEDAL